MYTYKTMIDASISSTNESALLILIIVSIILVLILLIAALYLVATLRRRSIILKKADYLIEDITYKSESLNVTVETLNKLSNYLLSFDSVSQKGFKSLIKLISENRNYIYSIAEKLREDVEEKQTSARNSKKTKTKTTSPKKEIKKEESKVETEE